MLILGVAFLLLLGIVMFSVAAGTLAMRSLERRKVRGFLAQLDERPRPEVKAAATVRTRKVPEAEGALERRLELALQQAAVGTPLRKMIAVSAGLSLAGATIGFLLRGLLPEPAGSLLLAVSGAALPVLHVRRRIAARLRAFEAQFPDALEFLPDPCWPDTASPPV